MKKAIVVSGGGSKGAYAVGVLEQFRESKPDLNFNVFVGTSTGALIMPFLALGRLDTLSQIYQNTKTKQVIKQKSNPPSFNNSSIYSTSPLRELIDANLSDAECDTLIHSNDKEIYIITVCLQTKKLTIFANRDLPATKSNIYDVVRLQDANQFKRALLASANQPVLMPPIRVNKDIANDTIKERQYIDGGVMQYAGIEVAMDTNSDEIFTIFLSAEQDQTTSEKYTKLLDMVGPTIGILTGNVGFNDLRIPRIHNTALEFIEKAKKNLLNQGVSPDVVEQAFDITIPNQDFEFREPYRIHLIRPSQKLEAGTNGLDFNPSEMRVMFQLGRDDARRFVENGQQIV